MEDDYGSNVHAELEKSVRFRVSTLEKFCYKGFLSNSSGAKFCVRLREVSALQNVRFREVPLYCKVPKYYDQDCSLPVIFPLVFSKNQNCL